MQHTLGSAARMAGLSKSTLSRAIKDGKMSAIRSDDTGSYKIEQSELERYLAAVAVIRVTAENRAALQATTQPEHRDFAVLEVEIAGLKQLADLLRSQLSDTMKQQDAWQQQAERLALPRPERPAAETRPATRPAPVPVPQARTWPVQLGNPLAQIWQWLADRLAEVMAGKLDQLDRVTISKPTAPDSLVRFGHGGRVPTGEPRRSEVPQFLLDRERFARELERAPRDATLTENSPSHGA